MPGRVLIDLKQPVELERALAGIALVRCEFDAGRDLGPVKQRPHVARELAVTGHFGIEVIQESIGVFVGEGFGGSAEEIQYVFGSILRNVLRRGRLGQQDGDDRNCKFHVR